MKPLREALAKHQGTLRVVLVDIPISSSSTEEATVDNGEYVVFVYDAKDQLLGIAIDTYMLD
jgi:hypothetical protein